MTRCFLALGSNLKSPERQLRRAISSLRTASKITINAISKIYYTQPLGNCFQPKYCNQVISICTHLPPAQLLRVCQQIENNQQRVRKRRWGPRTLDIDILLYGHQIIDTKTLTVPHPEMLKRDFVLMPLLEIAPDLKVPNGTFSSIR